MGFGVGLTPRTLLGTGTAATPPAAAPAPPATPVSVILPAPDPLESEGYASAECIVIAADHVDDIVPRDGVRIAWASRSYNASLTAWAARQGLERRELFRERAPDLIHRVHATVGDAGFAGFKAGDAVVIYLYPSTTGQMLWLEDRAEMEHAEVEIHSSEAVSFRWEH